MVACPFPRGKLLPTKKSIYSPSTKPIVIPLLLVKSSRNNWLKFVQFWYIIWLVVWLPFFIFPYIGFLIIPIDFHIFQRGGPTNQIIYIKLVTYLLRNLLENPIVVLRRTPGILIPASGVAYPDPFHLCNTAGGWIWNTWLIMVSNG